MTEKWSCVQRLDEIVSKILPDPQVLFYRIVVSDGFVSIRVYGKKAFSRGCSWGGGGAGEAL